MIVVVADTHGRGGHRLRGAILEAVRAADLVVHAGDFTAASVWDAFEAEADALAAVHGNNDDSVLRDRLPAERLFEHGGWRVAVAHGHEHTETALPLFGRESGADLVVVGHSHRPGFERIGGVPVLNPGSHAEPRWYRPGFATLEVTDDAIDGCLLEPDGTLIDTFRLEGGLGRQESSEDRRSRGRRRRSRGEGGE